MAYRAPMPEAFDPTQFDPHAPAFIADPYPTYASFREHAPVHPVKPYGSHWVFGYEDCAKVLSETEIWVKKGVAQHAHGPYGVMAGFPRTCSSQIRRFTPSCAGYSSR